MRAFCQICGEFYSEVSIEGVSEGGGIRAIAPLRYPLTGVMFGSSDPFHGVPPPFDPSLTWEFMRCIYGRIHRPMVQDDLILTHKGMVRLPKDGSQAYLDPTASSEVDRDSISDRVMQVPDDVAERMARETIGRQINTDIVQSIADEESESEEKPKECFQCPACKRSFDTRRQLNGHIGGAHRVKRGK